MYTHYFTEEKEWEILNFLIAQKNLCKTATDTHNLIDWVRKYM